jgi:hypothetical protein
LKSKGDGVGHVMMIKLFIWKRRKRKTKAQGKGDIYRSFCVLVIETPSGCDHI